MIEGRGRVTRRRVLVAPVVLALSGLALAACGAGASAGGALRAVGAENQYANVIAQVGGRYVSVVAIMSDPTTDPHTFEASTGVARDVANAQLIVQNGLGYDTFMNQLESASPSASRRVIVAQHLLGLATDTKNPHLWYLPTTMARVAARVERDFASLAPAHRSYFRARLATFRASLGGLDAAIAAFRARYAGDDVATTEPVADDLLRALGLRVQTPWRFQADVMNGVDPSPEDVAFQDELLSRHRVAVFCYNAQVVSSITVAMRALAQRSGVPVVGVYETMPTPGYDYQRWMLAEIHALARALSTKTSTTSLLS